jgi:hypothetical protein
MVFGKVVRASEAVSAGTDDDGVIVLFELRGRNDSGPFTLTAHTLTAQSLTE